jgi:hypothetical protein
LDLKAICRVSEDIYTTPMKSRELLMMRKKNATPKRGNTSEWLTEIGPALAVIALGAFLYFREDTVFWGVAIPDYTGLIFAFVGIFWIFYKLFSPK